MQGISLFTYLVLFGPMGLILALTLAGWLWRRGGPVSRTPPGDDSDRRPLP